MWTAQSGALAELDLGVGGEYQLRIEGNACKGLVQPRIPRSEHNSVSVNAFSCFCIMGSQQSHSHLRRD